MGENWKQRWIKKEGFKEAVEESRKKHGSEHGGSMVERIVRCRKNISLWKRRNQPNSAIRIQKLHLSIDQATQKNPPNKQKSRSDWLQAGDKNTNYFRATTKARRARNRIQSLIDDQEKECFSEEEMGRVAEAYFRNLFTSEGVGYRLKEMETPLNCVSQSQNNSLVAPVTVDEAKKAIFEINPHKSPGPDRMNGFFYQQFWDCMGEDITKMVQEFFVTESLDKEFNKTNICLIPKVLKPVKLTEFRPISLCNVAYKVIAKIMANRLKRVLPTVISETQAAFVKCAKLKEHLGETDFRQHLGGPRASSCAKLKEQDFRGVHRNQDRHL